MGFCFGPAQNREDALGQLPRPGRQICTGEDIEDFRQPAVLVMMMVVAVGMVMRVAMGMVVVMVMFMHMAMCVVVAVEVRHVVVVVLVGGVQHHVKITGVQPGFFDTRYFDVKSVQRQAGQRLAQHSLVRAQVQQGGGEHITAQARVAL